MRTVLTDPYYEVRIDDARRAVFVRRTSVAFPDLDAVNQTFSRLIAVLSEIEVRGHRCVVDMRDVPGRNDEAFEETVARYRPQLFGPFVGVVMVVKSAVGRMQVQRMMGSNHGERFSVATDDAEIDAALRS